MLKIGAKKREPYDIEIVPGVKFTVRPVKPADIVLARHEWSKAGQAVSDDEDRLAVAGVAFTIGIAKRVTLSWSGIGDAKGKPLKLTLENVEAAFNDPGYGYRLWQGFEDKYVTPMLAGLNEKNAFAPSRRGTSRGATKAKTTAKTASRKTSSPAAASAVRT